MKTEHFKHPKVSPLFPPSQYLEGETSNLKKKTILFLVDLTPIFLSNTLRDITMFSFSVMSYFKM